MRTLCLALLVALAPAVGADAPHAGLRTFELTYGAPASDAGPAEQRTRAVTVWYPTTVAAKAHRYGDIPGVVAKDAAVAPGRHPVALFSHGLYGRPAGYAFLVEGLARAGYVVAAIQHRDVDRKARWARRPAFLRPQIWSAASHLDRRQDIVALLDHLLAEDRRAGSWLEGRVARDQIGAVGHSMGGYTLLGAVGGWPEQRDARIKAALLLSPYIMPYLEHAHAGKVDVPVMLQGATLDVGITPFLPKLYERLTGCRRYLMVLHFGTHIAWCSTRPKDGATTIDVAKTGNERRIMDYSVAFLDRHVRGQVETTKRLDRGKPLGLASFKTAAPAD